MKRNSWRKSNVSKKRRGLQIVDPFCGSTSSFGHKAMSAKTFATVLHNMIENVVPAYSELLTELCTRYPEKEIPLLLGTYRNDFPWITKLLSERLKDQAIPYAKENS